jgi:hypothetical protein
VSGADDYEKKYMGGEGALARSRASMPWWFHALLGGSCAMLIATAIASGSFAGLLSLPILAIVWLLFLYLRVTVTHDMLHVQLGLFGPKIPIGDIVEVIVDRYDALKYGGWGIRLGLDGSVAYSVPGHGGKGLRIRFMKGGRERTVFVTSPNAEELLAAIERVRGTRIDASPPEVERIAEELETVEEDQREKQS